KEPEEQFCRGLAESRSWPLAFSGVAASGTPRRLPSKTLLQQDTRNANRGTKHTHRGRGSFGARTGNRSRGVGSAGCHVVDLQHLVVVNHELLHPCNEGSALESKAGGGPISFANPTLRFLREL